VPLLFFAAMSDEPEYVICLECETPTYQFEYTGGKLTTIVCMTCGNDDPSEFMTEAELEELT
jgi:translation initiation factor 2 beta subunit (eIF-2beta)/eIF-5